MTLRAGPHHPAGLPERLLERLAAEGRERPRTLVMGVVNVTPDSFSDGGLWLEPEAGIAHGLTLHEQGADLVDVGGESTRPGAERPSVEEELRRVIPVVRALSAAGVVVSVDTMRAVVAAAALEAGAALVNDVSGGLADPDLPPLSPQAGGALRRDALAGPQHPDGALRRLRRRRRRRDQGAVGAAGSRCGTGGFG